MEQIFERLADEFGLDAISAWLGRVLPGLIKAALILLVFYLLWRLVRRGLEAIRSRTTLDPTLAAFLNTGLKSLILMVGLIVALAELGVNTASLLASLGVAGLTLGFAAKDALSNIISGLFIFWDRPFVVGDLIENDGFYGRVEDITLRSTRVVTPDGKMLAIPNSTIVNTTVASYTNFPHLRIDIPVTIGVAEDIDRAREVLLGVVAGDARFLATPRATVTVDALNDYNVLLTLSAWLDDEKTHVAARADLREAAYKALTGAGVDLPFETVRVLGLAAG